MLNKEYYGGVLPKKDDRDYIASHILGVENLEIPKSFKMYTKANNQGASAETRVACTCYATYNVATLLNEVEHLKHLNQRPFEGWKEQKKFGTHNKYGDYLNTAFKSIIQNGLITDNKNYTIDSYSRINLSDVKYWISQGFPIITSGAVSKTNFKRAKSSGVYIPYDENPTSTYHAFALLGYDDDKIIALNSYGETWGRYKDGTFQINEGNLRQLGTMYILYDSKDVELIFRDVSTNSPYAEEIRWCLEKGLMNGYDSANIEEATKRFFKPEQPISRGEFAVVLQRFFELINKK